MKPIVVDIQGFISEKKFYAKEMAIFDGTRMNHYLFEESIGYHDLSKSDKKQVQYVTRNVHGLPYSSGCIPYKRLNDILKTHIFDTTDVVYVRGHQKKNLLDVATKEEDCNLEIIDVAVTYPDAPKFNREAPLCMNHNPGLYMCSIRNCHVLYDWLSTWWH